MDYTSDSDVSEDTRDLVNQGLASVRRKRTKVVGNSDDVCQPRLVPNTDISSVRHQTWTEDSIGAASARDLNPLMRTINTSQNHNIFNSCTLLYEILFKLEHSLTDLLYTSFSY